jgi:transglutaminase-like putative cysteine protease
MKTYNIVLLLLIYSSHLFCQQTNYKVSDIADELKKNAKAVIRFKKVEFQVKSEQQATMNISYAITILNENGIESSFFREYYDKFTRINNIKAVVYDQNGEKAKRVSSDDIIDHSAISGYSIYEDNRVKLIDPKYRTVPFTVEYSYQVQFKGFLYFPSWFLYDDYNISVERSGFHVVVPENYQFRYSEKNIDIEVKEFQTKGIKTYTWEVSDLPAIKDEPFSLPPEEYLPAVIMAPSDFELSGYKGNCDSWKSFGEWINKLNEGRNELSLETQNHIRELTKSAGNDREKVKILYSYLQNKTRYVSIQVGIGGFQPFEAGVVDKYSYGDCKALTNYMRSILEIAGIKSYYCLVYAGSNAPRMIKDFPSSQFNHAFLCVPVESDTIWLECTSQHYPCGYYGTFTDDRDVLLVDEHGGKIVHTKAYAQEENKQLRNIDVFLDGNGDGIAKIYTKYLGPFFENIHPLLLRDDFDRKKKMYDRIRIPNFEIINFTHELIKNRIPEVIENTEVALWNYGVLMGDKMFFNLNLMNQLVNLPNKMNDRKSDIFVRRSYIETDTIIFNIPEGYSVYKIPSGVTVSSKFGEYKTNVISNDTTVKFVRYFNMHKGTYPVSEYDDFVNFFESIFNEDGAKMILNKI